MSLAARIQLKPSHTFTAIVVLVAVCGFVLLVLTLIARAEAGASIWILPALFPGLLLPLQRLRRRSMNQWGSRLLTLRIIEDGSLLLEAAADQDQGSASDLATMPKVSGPYQLAPGSLIWPGLFILRLQEGASSPIMDQSGTNMVSLVITRRNLTTSNRRALARLLIWAQRKTPGYSLTHPLSIH